MSTAEDFHYEGFSGPNGTIVPDDVFDVLAPRLSEAELRVLLYIVRRTFGFGKNADAISLKQLTSGIVTRDGRVLDHGTGMSRKAVIKGCQGLAEKGVISIERRCGSDGNNHVNIYKLRFKEQRGVVTQSNQDDYPTTPPPVTAGNTQESVKQESVKHNNNNVVASLNDSEERLYEDLKAIGVHHNTASKLLREHAIDRIQLAMSHLLTRLQSGWQPRETPAAWLVAALNQGYELPTSSNGRQKSSEASPNLHERQVQSITEATEHQFTLKRQEMLRKYGIDKQGDKFWSSIQEALKQSGQWSPIFAGVFLRLNADNSADIIAPAILLSRVESHRQAIIKAITQLHAPINELHFRSL